MKTQLSVVPKTIEELEQAIKEEWQRAEKGAEATIAAFISIGNYILDAEKFLGVGTTDYHGFINKLPFTHSHAVKFKKLALNPVITNKSNWKDLPPSIYTLYQLALMDPKDLLDDLSTGKISPKSTRDQVKSAASKSSYQPFCTILISSSLTPMDRYSLVASASTAIAKYPGLSFKLSKEVKKEGLAYLRARAEKEYDRLIAEYTPKNRKLTSLVEHAIEAIRKSSSKTLPADFGGRDQLKNDLGVDTSQEIRESNIYKAARVHKVVCRFLSFAKLDPHLKLWTSVIAWCDTGNPKKLQQFAKEKIQGTTKAHKAKKKNAMTQAQDILDDHRAYISA